MSSPRAPAPSLPASSPSHQGSSQHASGPSRTGTTTSERAFGWALAAAAGLCLAGCDKADESKSAEKPVTATDGGAKNCCHGKNECKGKGGCAVMGKHGCAGKNECKGQGGCNMHCPK